VLGQIEDAAAPLVQLSDVAIAREIGSGVGGPRTGSASGSYSECRPALPVVQDPDIPSAEQRIHPRWRGTQEPTASPYRQRVEVGGVERVRLIEVGTAAVEPRVEPVDYAGGIGSVAFTGPIVH